MWWHPLSHKTMDQDANLGKARRSKVTHAADHPSLYCPKDGQRPIQFGTRSYQNEAENCNRDSSFSSLRYVLLEKGEMDSYLSQEYASTWDESVLSLIDPSWPVFFFLILQTLASLFSYLLQGKYRPILSLLLVP